MTKDIQLNSNFTLAQYIVEHADELQGKAIEITDFNEISRYKATPIFYKYLKNNFAGYSLTTEDNKIRMVVNNIYDKDGFRTGFSVESVDTLLNYQRQSYFDKHPKFYGFTAPKQEDDKTVIDYLKENKVPEGKSLLIRDDELRNKFTKVGPHKYVPNNGTDAYMLVDSYAGFSGVDVHVVKQIVENLTIPTKVYDGRNADKNNEKVVLTKIIPMMLLP